MIPLGQVHAQCPFPSSIADTAHIILWLCPNDQVYDSGGNPAGIGDEVYTWGDKSPNGWSFQNSTNSNRPLLDTSGGHTYLYFDNGDMLQHTGIADTINGLNEFSIYFVIKSDVTNTDNGIMYWKHPPDGQDDGLTIRYDASGANDGGTNLIKAGMLGNDPNNQIETTSNTQTTDRQVLTLTWKSGGKLYSYIDGTPNDSSDASFAGPLASIDQILLGKGAKDENNNESWDGGIGSIIFYDYQQPPNMVAEIAEALPVELLYFRAGFHGRAVELEWATASERDNSHFLLQRSADGINYITLASVPGYGNSSQRKNYNYTDWGVGQAAIYYYRLVQVDYGGRAKKLKTIVANTGHSDEQSIMLQPNPVPRDGSFRLFTDGREAIERVWLKDQMGTLVHEYMFTACGCKDNEFSLPPGLGKGVYYLVIDAGKNNHSLKLLVL